MKERGGWREERLKEGKRGREANKNMKKKVKKNLIPTIVFIQQILNVYVAGTNQVVKTQWWAHPCSCWTWNLAGKHRGKYYLKGVSIARVYNLGFHEEVIINLRNDGWEFVSNGEVKGKSSKVERVLQKDVWGKGSLKISRNLKKIRMANVS